MRLSSGLSDDSKQCGEVEAIIDLEKYIFSSDKDDTTEDEDDKTVINEGDFIEIQVGKIILPFYSHCGGVPADFRNDIKNICPGSDVREPLNVIGDGGGQIEDVVEIWLQENGIMES